LPSGAISFEIAPFRVTLGHRHKGVMNMEMKIALSTIALILLPAMSFAAGCNYDKQAMSCAAGTVYDADSHSCIETTT
jgi:hypothetical protein